ncbi:MAG TPA: TonB-dependent receptor [Steroidobacteraceae bacterium]|nr:TonB-dependent receptor [Steroidobacteraceae bacterium]
MFRPKNNGPAVAATMALVSACPMLALAADEPAAPDTAAADPGPAGAPGGAVNTSPNPTSEIVVTAQKLNDARAAIQTQTGASTYTIDSTAIEAIPGGQNAPLNQVILQAPDVAQDSFGQLHIRGEHNGLQYRLNGIILPEGISVFSQTLDSRLVDKMQLVMGALPAEYGLRTAGIIDLTTKSGILEPHGDLSLYGGSHNTIEPSLFHGGSIGALNYFVSLDFLRNNLGIESPYNAITPIHDETKQYHGFGYFEYILDPDDRVSWILGTSHGEFQIPNTPGLAPDLGLTVNGQTDFPSALLNENQTEITHYAIVSFQHSAGPFDLQTSASARYTSLTFFPDPLGDLLYTGIAQNAYKRDVAYSWQTDASYHLGDVHTLRFGFYLQHDKATSATTSQVLPVDDTGAQTTDIPISIVDNGDETQMIESAYLQDEWRVLDPVTINYGVRFDHYTAYSSGHQVSPRVNIVWKPLDGMTVHGGYSRYFSPPPFELIGGKSLNLFNNTTYASAVTLDTAPLAESANYYDVGIQQQFPFGFTAGLDTYYKQSTNLIDEGQFGAPIILTPFNYRYGQQYGVELTLNYVINSFNAYANLATQRARGKQIETAQFNFAADDLAYIANHYISLDHEQQYTASAGAAYTWNNTRFSGDLIFGSGLRSDLTLPDGSSIPNGAHLPYYRQVNLGITQALTFWGGSSFKDSPTLRFDVTNVFDTAYQIRNGTGVGVGAPQWGPRRGYFAGITIPF